MTKAITDTAPVRAGREQDAVYVRCSVGLRYMASQAVVFAEVLDELRGRYAELAPERWAAVISIVEQAAAAASDLAVAADQAADVTKQHDGGPRATTW